MGGKITQLGYLRPPGGGGGGGQDKPAGISYPPGVKISRVGGKISRDSLPPGVELSRGQDKLLHRYFKINLAQLFIQNICSGRLKVTRSHLKVKC